MLTLIKGIYVATLNVSSKQKDRVLHVQGLVNEALQTDLSQAQIVEMGLALLEAEYGI
jgi:hypothetical protein